MKLFRNLMLLSLVLLVAAPLAAAEEKAKKAKGKGAANAGIFANIAKLDLNAEQKEKLAAVKKTFGPKLTELRKKAGLSAETRKARAAAQKEATEKGLKGKDRQEFLDSKSNLTDDQKKAVAEMAAATLKAKAAIAAFLTDEQKAKAKIGGKKSADAPKKKKAKKPADK